MHIALIGILVFEKYATFRTRACSVHTFQKPSTPVLILRHLVGQPILAAAAFHGLLRLRMPWFPSQETRRSGIVFRSC
jgi:hypothetical protein